MQKIKLFNKLTFLVALIVCLACGAFMGNTVTAYADETKITAPVEPENPAETGEGDADDKADDGALKSLVDGFLAQLKAKYGDDYETYYNAVIEQWGSIEEYLLSLVDEEDATAEGWRAFVGWLNEYAPVWGSILAITAIVIVVLLGKKALNKVALFVSGTGGQFKTVFGEMNKIDKTLKAQNAALVKLLGENEKFKAEREELEKTSKEIGGDGEV